MQQSHKMLVVLNHRDKYNALYIIRRNRIPLNMDTNTMFSPPVCNPMALVPSINDEDEGYLGSRLSSSQTGNGPLQVGDRRSKGQKVTRNDKWAPHVSLLRHLVSERTPLDDIMRFMKDTCDFHARLARSYEGEIKSGFISI